MNSITLCIVMPAYNEQDCIEAVVINWLKVLNEIVTSNKQGCIVVVNDGSKDKTGDLLDKVASQHCQLKIVHQVNGGHGNALMNAYRTALALEPEWIFHVDSDNQFIPEDLQLLWKNRNNSPFIMGYRKIRYDAFHRLVITRIMRLLNFFLFGIYIDDANVPFRLIRAEYLEKIISVIPKNVFAPNIFISIIAKKDGKLKGQIPIVHQDRQTGNVSIVKWNLIKVCLRTAIELTLLTFTLKSRVKKLQA